MSFCWFCHAAALSHILEFILPLVYKVYRGYIVFCLFSNNICVLGGEGCKLVFFLFVKDFSGTTEPLILKFGTNVGYNLLYCVRENQPPPAYHSHYLSIFLLSLQFSPIQISVTDFSASMRAKVFKFCIHLDSAQVYCGKENQDAGINFCLLFPIFCFFPSLTPMYIGKFVSKISQEQLHLGF